MIGYISPYKPELKYKEMALYKAYYCSVCKVIKKTAGRPFCFGLSHDLTSFLFLQSSLQPDEEKIVTTTCTWNPFFKVNILTNYQDEIKYTAILNIFLVYYKAKDNSMDDRTPLSFLIQAMFWLKYRKLKKEYIELNELIYKALQKYNQNEFNKDESIEMIIDPYATMIGTMMSCLIHDPYVKKCLFWVGYHTAKSICIIDAIDDFEDDYKHKTTNILRLKNMQDYTFKVQQDYINNEKEIAVDKVLSILDYSLHQMKTTISALPILRNNSIIENIFNDGVNNSVTKVLYKKRSD